MIETARAGQGEFEPIGRSEEWTILSPAVAQSKEQTKAVQEVLRSRDLVTAIHGPAGSGKTTLMREAVNALETLSGKDVLVLARGDALRILQNREPEESQSRKQKGKYRDEGIRPADGRSAFTGVCGDLGDAATAQKYAFERLWEDGR